MEENSLLELLKIIEYGTKLHISVVFLDDFGNDKTALPFSYTIHSMPICDTFKSDSNGRDMCIRCRNAVLKRVIRTKKSLYGICINGVFEYCHPVLWENKVICVIFIGNILPSNSKRLMEKIPDPQTINTMQADFGNNDCAKTARVIENYIKFLLNEYPAVSKVDPLIQNIKNFIEENINFNFKLSEISQVFNYNEKYLGKLFKKKTGQTVKDYLNQRRMALAKKLLKETELSVTEIAVKIGFNSVTYFNRVFKCDTKQTPSEFRKSYR